MLDAQGSGAFLGGLMHHVRTLRRPQYCEKKGEKPGVTMIIDHLVCSKQMCVLRVSNHLEVAVYMLRRGPDRVHSLEILFAKCARMSY